MSQLLVDTSFWISFFRGDSIGQLLFPYLDSNLICTNDLILSELIPSIQMRNETHLVAILMSIERKSLNIDWDVIRQMQITNMRKGIYKVGIPDLIIAQNAIQNNIPIVSLDRHFKLMSDSIGVRVFEF